MLIQDIWYMFVFWDWIDLQNKLNWSWMAGPLKIGVWMLLCMTCKAYPGKVAKHSSVNLGKESFLFGNPKASPQFTAVKLVEDYSAVQNWVPKGLGTKLVIQHLFIYRIASHSTGQSNVTDVSRLARKFPRLCPEQSCNIAWCLRWSRFIFSSFSPVLPLLQTLCIPKGLQRLSRNYHRLYDLF